MNCEICEFNNPKGTVTAIIIREGKLLVVRRAEEPFEGMLDFPGGYMQSGEIPEKSLKRELKEELGINTSLMTKIGEFPGTAKWKNKQFPILSHAFLAETNDEIILNEEINEFFWLPIKEVNDIAFDSNQKILEFVKGNFDFNLNQVKVLVSQLDSSAQINEQSLYKAVLSGFISKKYSKENNQLIGMGWIFIRQTALRKQAVVEDLIVDESQRGKGLGTKIMNELIEWAKIQGCQTIELTTNPKREAANALYQKLGFQLHITNHYLYNI